MIGANACVNAIKRVVYAGGGVGVRVRRCFVSDDTATEVGYGRTKFHTVALIESRDRSSEAIVFVLKGFHLLIDRGLCKAVVRLGVEL